MGTYSLHHRNTGLKDWNNACKRACTQIARRLLIQRIKDILQKEP